jgi:predicted peroxiredoxin
MVFITLSFAVISITTVGARLYAIEQPSTLEGINEEKCAEIDNCKIITKDVFKYPDVVSPFGKNQQLQNLTNNIKDSTVEKQSCEKLMDVDIIKKKDQKPGEQTPRFTICLPQ